MVALRVRGSPFIAMLFRMLVPGEEGQRLVFGQAVEGNAMFGAGRAEYVVERLRLIDGRASAPDLPGISGVSSFNNQRP